MSILKYALPAAALGAMLIPGVGPAISAGLSGAGSAIGGGLASLGGASALGAAGAASTGAGIASRLGPILLQGLAGYALGGPQGAMQVPLMAQNAQHRNPGMSPLQASISPILGGLAGRTLGGGQAGGLAGMGFGGLLDPWTGPLAHRPKALPDSVPQPQSTFTDVNARLPFSPMLVKNPSLMIPLIAGLRR